MMDEIFELILKEARTRSGDEFKLNCYYVINDLYKRVFNTIESSSDSFLNSPSTDDEAA